MFRLLAMILIFAGCLAAGCASTAVNSSGEAAAAPGAAERKISITAGGKKAVVLLNGTQAAERLYKSLPLTLEFSDYNNTEKIANPPEPLHRQLSPEGHTPAAGDLCIYAPWGNLCLFYRDYHGSGDLFYLGRVQSGMEYLTENEKFTAVLDRVE